MKKYLAIAGAGLMLVGTAGLAAAATIDVGGEVRIKYENRQELSFDSDGGAAEHGTHQRTRINVNAKVNDEISGFIQLQNIRTWGGEAGANSVANTTDNSTNTDVHQAYIQVNKVFGTPLSVRIGRQELAYGDHRLVGSLDWADSARAFDAVKVMYNAGDIALDVWSAKVDEMSWGNNTGSSNIVSTDPNADGTDTDLDFYGAWLTYKGIKDNVIDVYALVLRDGTPSSTINGIVYNGAGSTQEGALSLYTLGARLKGAMGGLDYTVEINRQQGNDTDDRDIESMGYAVNVGYTIPVDMSPRIYAEYVFADGDDNSSDDDVETFNQLFPTGHAHLGYMDLVGFQNVEAWRFGASIKPTKALYIQADYWNFKLAEDKDAWYRASGGSVIAANSANSEDDIGGEVDLTIKYKYSDNLSLEGGYSIFFAGDIVDQHPSSSFADDDDMSWAYAQVKLTF